MHFTLQSKLEAQYALKREAADNDIVNLKQQLDIKEQEKNSMSVTIESLRGANEELKASHHQTP
jgi:kinesin family protein 5